MISLLKKFLNHPFNVEKDVDITTISIHKDNVLDVMWILKKNSSFLFTQLSDLCAVD